MSQTPITVPVLLVIMADRPYIIGNNLVQLLKDIRL
jgi:hypothetical protein